MVIFETKPFEIYIYKEVYLNEFCRDNEKGANINTDFKPLKIFNIRGVFYVSIICLTFAKLALLVEINIISETNRKVYYYFKHIINNISVK